MTIRYRSGAEAARLKLEKVRRPIAWKIHADDSEREASAGQHCQTQRCRKRITVVTWRWWRSTEANRVLLTEHFRCDQHGEEFATRYGITIEAPPDRPSRHT